MTVGKKRSANQGSYADYTLEIIAKIGKYTAENGPVRASRHLSVSKTTVRSVLGKSVKFEKLLITCTIMGKCMGQILYLSNFPHYTVDMSTDIIVTAKIYICQCTHVLQRCTRLWL